MDHELEKLPDGGWTCSTCRWEWKSKPQTLCPGVPRYDWGDVPDHLKTQTQLGKMGLKPAKEQQPEACVYSQSKTDYYWLYDIVQAIPKRKATLAQLAALEKGRSVLDESIALAGAGRGILEPYREGLIEVRYLSNNGVLTVCDCCEEVPDPAWDYAALWQYVMHLQQDINAPAQLLSQQQHASPEADQLICKYLDQIGDRMIAAHHLLPASKQTSTGSYILDAGDRGKYHVNN